MAHHCRPYASVLPCHSGVALTATTSTGSGRTLTRKLSSGAARCPAHKRLRLSTGGSDTACLVAGQPSTRCSPSCCLSWTRLAPSSRQPAAPPWRRSARPNGPAEMRRRDPDIAANKSNRRARAARLKTQLPSSGCLHVWRVHNVCENAHAFALRKAWAVSSSAARWFGPVGVLPVQRQHWWRQTL